MMGKPRHEVYLRFIEKYKKLNRQLGMDQYVVPYLMSSHPGCSMQSAVELAEYVRDLGYMPEQVQDFYPTPSTISTCMYYTGLDPRTMKPVYIPRDPHEKAMQRALIQYRDHKNHPLIREALTAAGRTDLIGTAPGCLVPPAPKPGRSAPAKPASGGKPGTPAQKPAPRKGPKNAAPAGKPPKRGPKPAPSRTPAGHKSKKKST